MNDKLLQIITMILLIGYVLTKEILAPLVRKLLIKNSRGNSLGTAVKKNPVNIDRFYQSFLDFKDEQGRWNAKREKEIEKLDSRIDCMEKRS